MSTIYTKEYFIAKFEAIPEERWLENAFSDAEMKRRCALGFCGDDGWWRGSHEWPVVDAKPERHGILFAMAFDGDFPLFRLLSSRWIERDDAWALACHERQYHMTRQCVFGCVDGTFEVMDPDYPNGQQHAALIARLSPEVALEVYTALKDAHDFAGVSRGDAAAMIHMRTQQAMDALDGIT